jgi:polar amino acid transport system substrate-binding protein
LSKKIVLFLLLFSLSITLLVTGCGKKAAEQGPADDSWTKIKTQGYFTVGLDDAFPPMGFHDKDDKLTGFDIEMGKELSKKLGVEIVWQPTAWDTVVASLKAKKFDVIISGMNMTKDRMKEVNFAGPYGKAYQILMVKADNQTIKSIKDVKPGKLGTQSGSTAHKIAKNEGFSDDQLKLYKEYPLAFNDLAIGRIDAVVCDIFLLKEYADKKPGVFKKVGEDMGGNDANIGIAVRKEDKQLQDALNQAIKELKEDGTLTRISQKWMNYDITAELK